MTAEEWDRTKQILETALALPEADRISYVLESTSDWLNVRSAVLELLPYYKNDPSSPPIKSSHVLAPGQLVAGRFRVARLIAAGGMGEVYEAYDEWLRLRLALKTLRYGQAADGDTLERFKRELLIARGVAQENLCRVYDFVEHRAPGPDGTEVLTPCFTMEFLEGETLADLLGRVRSLPCDEVLHIVRQVAAALKVLHERGIIHRDLKPSNIMIVPGAEGAPRAVVMDFGLAKPDTCKAEIFESAPDFEGAGAPYFMAPEIIRRQRPSFASDIYALGLLIDEMVTTSRAFASKSMAGLFYEKLQEQPIPPSVRATDLPPHWERTILRCIANDTSVRFSSASAVVQALEEPHLTEQLPEADAEPVAATPKASRTRRRLRLPRWAWIAALTCLPLTLGITGWTTITNQPISASVQVYDIENLTGVKENNYLAKGTTDQLMGRLLKVPGVRVYAVRSTRSAAPVAKVGRFSLDGTLQAHNGQIRLAMQLSDNGRQGDLLWSENFDSNEIKNPLRLQSDIAEKAVWALERRVLHGETAKDREPDLVTRASRRIRHWLAYQGLTSANSPTRSNKAFDLYMRGHNLLEEVSPSAAAAAMEYFEKAIAEDPEFALAYAAAADAHMQLMNYNYHSNADLAEKARTYAAIAVRQDPTLAEAHTALAAVRQMDWDWKGAEESYKEALRLKPGFGRARRWYAGLLAQFGRWDETIAEGRMALEQDPFDRSAPPALGMYLFLAGRYDEAVQLLTRAVAEKDMPMTRANLGEAYAWLAHTTPEPRSSEYFQLALQQASEILKYERSNSPGKTSFSDKLFALTYASKGDSSALQPYLDRLEQDMRNNGTSPVTLASVHALQGHTERACDLLEQAAVRRDRRLLYAKVVPFLSKLHGLPRFSALLRQMNLG